MGMDIDAYLVVGAIINILKNEDNIKISEEEYQEIYEGYLSEYLYEKLIDKGISIFKTNEYSEELIVYKEKAITSTSWDATIVDMETYSNFDNDLNEVIDALNELDIEIEKAGMILFPYYSH
jgi:hypothetical protein